MPGIAFWHSLDEINRVSLDLPQLKELEYQFMTEEVWVQTPLAEGLVEKRPGHHPGAAGDEWVSE